MRTATCSCGKLRAQCAGEPERVSLCHCGECQKRTGSAFGIAAFFDRASVAIAGEFTTYARGSESGHTIAFHFCPHCGTTLFWEPERKPDQIAVAVGAFADRSFPPPSREVYVELRHPWVKNAI
jgi:hypothetical protein